MRQDDRDNPATTSRAYEIMAPRWAKMETVLGGTEAMRKAGQAYMPQHAEEEDDRYLERVETATFLNMTELVLDTMVGRPFSDPVQLEENVPEQIKEYMKDVDLQGNNIDVFARQWFREGVAKGFAHVLIDFPRKEAKPDGRTRTLADDRSEGLRPYWVLIKPENLLFAHTRIINGEERVVHARILEETTTMDGFAEVVEQKIRVIEPGIQQIYGYDAKNDVWYLEDEFPYDLDFVPLVTFYAAKDGPFLAKPPLMDLADLNIAHWQSGSDQRMVLTVARFPILAMSGAVSEDAKLKIGPHRWLYNSDPQGKFYYVEHTGRAIRAGREDLKDLEAQMAHHGAEFFKKQPDRQTALARALDSAEATTPLMDMIVRFMDAVDHALWVTAQWIRLPEGGNVHISRDFGPESSDQNDMIVLQFARKVRDISRATFLSELKRRGVLRDEFDADKDLGRIEEEMILNISRIDTEDERPGTGVQGAQV